MTTTFNQHQPWYFKNGVEEQRLVGAAENEVFEQFLTTYPSES